MSKRKPFTAYQVLHAWLEIQIGQCRSVRPRGYEMPGDTKSTWGNTKARAAALVESMPLYDLCRRQLMEWCQAGLEDVVLVAEFMAGLEAHLQDYPFYPSSLADVEDGAGTIVVFRDVASVAKELGISESYLRKRLCTMPTSLPFGTFNDRRTWMIHPLDVPVLREHFDGVKRAS
jgi:hypothetical protein